MKRWMMSVYHGVRRRHLDIYLQEFVFRWNRRRQYRASFDSLGAIGHEVGHASYRAIVGRPPVLKPLMEQVRDRTKQERRQAYLEALAKGVPEVFAKRLLDPDYVEPKRPTYVRKRPQRPVLARSRTAFVFD